MNSQLVLSLLRFGVVGGSAFAVHFLCVIGLVSQAGMPPLSANILAFMMALPVSYFGHKNWTFAAKEQPDAGSGLRFLISALIGFAINEASYALLLLMNPDYYRLDLLIALLFSASSMYLLSRYWVFQGVQS